MRRASHTGRSSCIIAGSPDQETTLGIVVALRAIRQQGPADERAPADVGSAIASDGDQTGSIDLSVMA